jgi:hypothetical protein
VVDDIKVDGREDVPVGSLVEEVGVAVLALEVADARIFSSLLRDATTSLGRAESKTDTALFDLSKSTAAVGAVSASCIEATAPMADINTSRPSPFVGTLSRSCLGTKSVMLSRAPRYRPPVRIVSFRSTVSSFDRWRCQIQGQRHTVIAERSPRKINAIGAKKATDEIRPLIALSWCVSSKL